MCGNNHWIKNPYVHTCMLHGSTASMLHGCVCSNAYLFSGSSLLCTHWDSRSKQTRVIYYTFLHSGRRDYSLQYETDVHTYCTHVYASWTNCFFAARLCVCSNAYLCTGSRILCTHWDSHSKHGKINHDIFLHSDRRDYRLQIRMKHIMSMFHGTTTVHVSKY